MRSREGDQVGCCRDVEYRVSINENVSSMDLISEVVAGKNSLYTDYRAEFVAACLIENGLDANEVRIIREGLANGGKNIDMIAWENTSDGFSKYLSIYSKKRSLYESLPEGLFHKRMDIDDKKDKQAVIDYIKRERQVASNASMFFRPFEMTLDRFDVEANRYEMRLEKRDQYDDFIRLFETLNPLFKGLPLDKALFVVSLLSQTYRLTNPEQIAEILSVVLDCEVEIELSYKQMTMKAERCEWQLGQNRLNVSTVLGGEILDCFPVMSVRIESLPPRYKDLVFEDSKAYQTLLEIMDLVVPADTEIKININVAKEGLKFLLTDKESILGYSTILS